MIEKTLSALFAIGPVLFGIGFLAPVMAALMDAFALPPPFGLSTLETGLIAGFLWGTYAKLKGSWL